MIICNETKYENQKAKDFEKCYPYRFTLSYLPTPPLGQDVTQGQFLSGV